MGSIKSRNEFKKLLRDVTVQRHLLSYAKTNVDDVSVKESDDDIQSTTALAQVGQRILTSLRNVSSSQYFYNNSFTILLSFLFKLIYKHWKYSSRIQDLKKKDFGIF